MKKRDTFKLVDTSITQFKQKQKVFAHAGYIITNASFC